VTREWEDAVNRGAIVELQRLLTSGADINARDGHGQTALMLAARDGHSALVAWLIEHGAALDHTAKFGLSALMLAVIRQHVAIVRELTDAGADRSVRGTGAPGFAGKTALDLAMGLDHAEMIEILRSAPSHSGA
jgi:uncharacterized protein